MIEVNIENDRRKAKWLFPIKANHGDDMPEVVAHLMNKYNHLYDTRELWTVALVNTVLEKIANGENRHS